MNISIIVPVYNGGETITLLYDGILEREKVDGYSSEFIFLFDFGDEISLKILHDLQRRDPERVKSYYFKENYGQHKAILFGISKSKGEIIVTMDDDLQQSPSDVVKLIMKQKEGNFDIVYGTYPFPNHSLIRNIASLALKKLLTGSIKGLYKGFSSFRLLNRDIANRLLDSRGPDYDFIDANLGKISSNISEIKVLHNKSLKSASAYSLQKLILHIFFIIITYTKIIKVLFSLSVFFIVISFGFLIAHSHNPSSGKIIIAMGFIGGILLFLGFILLMIKKGVDGEYVPICSLNYTE